ncbi:MAG: phospholipid carrier-dependent glycosyltransferase [Chloroflexi bacterium]|nr:phospholipid carrier-dependent glycosyltransferase [Chloroflexota bacterium]
MSQKRITDIAIYVVLIVLFLAPRVPKIGSFVTLDEPSWLSQGANFYYALGQREFQNTVYEYQPAVTTMWIISFAMLAYFPEYRGFGQGYLDYEKGRLDPFLYSHGKDPLALLYDARLIQIFVILVLFLFLYYLLQRLIPNHIALFAILFASFDPFHLSQSRLLDHEAMLSLFVMVSVLALAIYLSQERRIIFLLLSGIAAGFAQLTKSSAIAILAPVGILLLIQIFQERQGGFFKALISISKIFAIWIAVLAATYFIFWPGMWVAPGKMLYEVYGNAFSYAFQGARLKVTGSLEVSQFNLNSNIYGIWEVARVFLGRTTPLTWLGILLGFAIPFTRDRELVRPYRQLFTLLVTTAIAFIAMISIAQGRNSPHYILTSYLAWNLLAGLGWFHFVEWSVSRISPIRAQQIKYAGVLFILFFQIWSAASFFPYYFTYQNPLHVETGTERDFPQFPYGEGLEVAAQYLASLPNAKDSTVLSYYGRGCFSYFYPGETVGFRPFWIDGAHAEDLLNAIRSADYLVVYQANQGQAEKYTPYLNILSSVKPLREIWLNGMKYVIIYKVDDLPDSVYQALSNL